MSCGFWCHLLSFWKNFVLIYQIFSLWCFPVFVSLSRLYVPIRFPPRTQTKFRRWWGTVRSWIKNIWDSRLKLSVSSQVFFPSFDLVLGKDEWGGVFRFRKLSVVRIIQRIFLLDGSPSVTTSLNGYFTKIFNKVITRIERPIRNETKNGLLIKDNSIPSY